ncbi:sulfotransferase family protein [Nitrosomonas communis]|uniref:Sulfotransferase family protein n=1 Tax=Nitrosomonas communis TaxID=44574 RepID=A0A1I4J0T3_9PROT|nr:sulfotransferase [Nitrosomonas communis]SFL59636.1 Sulfotransferase family protein [Nitrosomonas communis]
MQTYRQKTQHSRFPDFFVVGAPRCGTTSLCRYLARNPQICFSQPKETYFFNQLDNDLSEKELQRNYLDRYFAHFTAGCRAVGEGTVTYLYQPEAIKRIQQFNPNARFIVLVRNPLAMLPSYHQRLRYLLQEDEPDFEKAWALQSTRARGELVPKLCLDARLLAYSEIAKFGAQMQQLYAITERERTHVIVFDDLVADPLGVYQRALEFLHVDYDGQTRFERKYQSRMYRYRWLQRLLYLPVMRHGKVIDTLQRRLYHYNQDNSKRRGLISRLTAWNIIKESPAQLSPRMAAIVRKSLQGDIQLLSSLINRDLSSWLDTKKDYVTYRLLPYWKKAISVSTKVGYQRCKFSPKLE